MFMDWLTSTLEIVEVRNMNKHQVNVMEFLWRQFVMLLNKLQDVGGSYFEVYRCFDASIELNADLGLSDPWIEINANIIYDTSQWKDLNSKFVVQGYRDLITTNVMSFGKDVWLTVCVAMECIHKFDQIGNDLIENDELSDQTYDTWTVYDVSAYCGGFVSTSVNVRKRSMKKVDQFLIQFCIN